MSVPSSARVKCSKGETNFEEIVSTILFMHFWAYADCKLLQYNCNRNDLDVAREHGRKQKRVPSCRQPPNKSTEKCAVLSSIKRELIPKGATSKGYKLLCIIDPTYSKRVEMDTCPWEA
jgi:hypothetical protein